MQNQPTEHQQPPQSPAMHLPGQDSSQGRKLNYHRAAIACVYCRKRKIRCQLPKGNNDSCENCTRQKMICVILSVDQQADQERAASRSEDPSTAGQSPLTLTPSAESVAPEGETMHNHTFGSLETTLPPPVPGSYTDYSPPGGTLHDGMGGHAGFHAPLPILQSEPPAHVTAAVATVGWTPSLSPYTAHESVQHQLPSQHDLYSQHVPYTPQHHEHQNAFHPVLRSSSGSTDAHWSHAPAAQTTDAPGQWTYPLPPTM